jgi:hypothetical protein
MVIDRAVDASSPAEKGRKRQMSTVHSAIEQHPDLMALRAEYDRAAESMSAQATFGLTLLTSVYLAVSPWIIGFDSTTGLAVNNLVVGLTVAVLALCFSSALDRTHGLTWTMPFFGVWTVVAPWIMHGVHPTAGTMWSNIVAGALLTIFGLAVHFRMHPHEAHHG